MKKIMQKYQSVLLLTCFGVIVFFVIGEKGAVIVRDSHEYIEMRGYLQPIYPWFLWLFRQIFGMNHYLTVAAVAQGVIAILCLNSFVLYIRKMFYLNGIQMCLTYVFCLIPFVRDGMRETPRYIMSHGIATEGLAIPLFYLFVMWSMQTIYKKSLKYYLGVLVLTVLLALTRSQFLICFVINFFLLLYIVFGHQKSRKFLFSGAAMLLLSYVIFSGTQSFYRYQITGTTQSTWNSSYYLVHLLYCIDKEDVSLFDTQEEKDVFMDIYEAYDKQKFSHRYEGKGLYAKGMHWSYNFSKMYDVPVEIIKKRAMETGGSEAEIIEKCVALSDKYMQVLGKEHWLRYADRAFTQTLLGLVSSVFILKEEIKEISFIYGFGIILFTVGLAGYALYRNKRSKAALLALFTILFMLGNVAAVSITIYAQARYVTYSMGIFYSALFVLILEFWKDRNKDKRLRG